MKRVVGVWDLVFMNVSAILGLRWLPIAASYGAGAISLWILAVLLFFVPLALVSTEMATAWPEQGGLYVWTKYAFGGRSAFLVSWFYWITNFFFYPALLTFIAVSAAFLINPALAKNKWFVCAVIVGCLWFVTFLNIRGLRVSKWISNLGGTFGIIVPGIIIVVLAAVVVFILKHPVPVKYSWHALLPDFTTGSNISFLSILMFAMAGIEITPILAGEVRDPQKTFPKSILISAVFIIGLYILGTVALTFMLAPNKMGAASGIMDAISAVTTMYHIPLLLSVVTIMIIFGSIGGISVWIIAPIKMLFESAKTGVFPKAFSKSNKYDMPANAMLIQAAGITVIILGTAFLPSVNTFYETLVLMATITYFIPYLFMFVTFIKLRKDFPDQERPYHVPGGNFFAYLLAIVGLLSVILAIIIPFIMPPSDVNTVKSITIYEIELIGGTALFTLLGFWIYARRSK